MEIRNLKSGDHFIKWDSTFCRLETLNDCRAQVFVYDAADGKHWHNVSPAAEIQRVLGKDETEKELEKIAASNRVDTNKEEVMKKVVKNSGANLPDKFVKKYRGTIHTMERKGESWSLNGGAVMTLRDAMITVAKGLADTKRLDEWNPLGFFRLGKSIQVVKDFSEIEKPKVEKKVKIAKKIPVKTKAKKVAKKAKNGKKADLKFSKKAQTASKPKKSLIEMAKELSKTEAA
jgi:hypothetical protein